MYNQYKPSMFNYTTRINNELVLYNAFQGTKSICQVSGNKADFVCAVLNSTIDTNQIIEQEKAAVIDFLIKKGFLISVTTNEKNLRNKIYADYVCNDTLNLVIHTTKQCNFRCQYCYLDFESKPMTQEVESRVVKFINKQLYKYNRVKISWFGGEPLLEMGVIERISARVMALCKKAKKTYYASITTNGYLLTPKNLEKLVELNVQHFTITIDGVQTIHDGLRFLRNGGPTFETITNNLRYLRDNIKKSNIRVVIRSNITRRTQLQYLDFVDCFIKDFGKDSRFSLFVRPVRDAGGERVKAIENELLSSEESSMSLKRIADSLMDKSACFLSNYSELEPTGCTCPAMCNGKYTIDVEGNVGKCDSPEEGINIGYLSDTGNLVLRETNEEDWTMGCFEYTEQCENCFFSVVCFKGTCPLSRVKNENLKCMLRSTEIDAMIALYMNANNIPII